MTEIILATGGIIAVAAYVSAILALAVAEVIEESAAFARMVSSVAPVNQLTNQEVIA